MFGLIGSLFSFLGGIAPAVAQVFTAKTDAYTTEFVSMSETERAEYAANQQAVTAANTAKTIHGTTVVAQVLTFMFGVPASIHWGMTYLTASFPQLGLHTDPLLGHYADDEHTIALSFFILNGALPLVQTVTSRLLR